MSAFSDWLAQKFPGAASFIEKDVLPTLGKVIESPLGVPLVVADKVVNEIFRRPIATAFTVAQSLQTKDPISPREAYNLTDREALPGIQITPGQAASTFLGQTFLNNPLARIPLQATKTDEKIYKMIPFLNPDFNITDTDERRAAYKDSFWGSIITGTGDIAFELAGAKGVGSGIKAAKLGTGVTRSAVSPKFLDQTRANVLAGGDAYKAQGSPTSLKDFRTPNGDSVWVFDILNSKTGSELLKNPILRGRPDLADMAAATQTWEEAAGFYLMAQGDTLAARALKGTAPSIADAYEKATKIEKIRPLTPDELATYQVIPTARKVKEGNAIFADLIKRKPEYKSTADEFTKEMIVGLEKASPVWAPSQYSFIERFRYNKAAAKNLRLTSTNANDITEEMIGGGVFRTFAYMGLKSNEQKTLGYMSLSSTRALDLMEEGSAYTASSSVLRGMANSKDPVTRQAFVDFKETSLREIRQELNNETTLKAAIERMEKRAMQMIVREIVRQKKLKTTFDADDTINKIIIKRDSVRTASIASDLLEDQTRDLYIKLSPNLKTKLADSVPLIDLDKFTIGALQEIDSASALKNTGVRNFTFTFESFNSLFSTSVLVRPGYIPKNSMFEPAMRVMAETGSFIDLEYALPGTINWTRNIGAGFDARVIAPFSKKARDIRKQRKEATEAKKKVIESDLPEIEKKLVIAKEEAAALGTRRAKEEVKTLEKAKAAVEENVTRLEGLVASLSGDLESFFATRQGAKHSILDREQTLNVLGKKQKVAPLYGGPGGRASISDIDATIAIANSVGATRQAASIADSNVRMTVTPGMKNYWEARAELTEKLRANDASFRLALEGKESGEIAKALMNEYNRRGQKSDLYRLYVSKTLDDLDKNIAPEKKGVPTIEDARFFAMEAVDEVQKLLPDVGLREIALQRPIKVKELRARYQNQPNAPEVTAIIPVDDIGAATRVINKYNKISTYLFRQLVKPEVRLWRNPFALREGKRALEALYTNAKLQGVTVDAAMYNQFRQIARRYATQRVEETFYQVRRFNNAQFYSRFIIGFSTAMFNSLRFWTKAGLNNPYQFALLEQIRTIPWDVGTVVGENGELLDKRGYLINDQGQYINDSGTVVGKQNAVLYDGESYLALPYYEDIWARIQGKPGYEGVRPYGKKVNTRMFNFLVNGPNPVWWAQVGLGFGLTASPQMEDKIKNVLDWDGQGNRRFGDLVFSGRPAVSFRPTVAETAEEGFLFFIPRWIREGAGLVGVSKDKFFGEGGVGEDFDPNVNDKLLFRKDRYADTLWLVHMARRYNEETEDPNTVVDMKTSQELAYGILWTRFLEKVFSPIGITYQPASQQFQDERLKLVKYYTDNPELRKGRTPDDAAISDLIAKHGSERVGSIFGLTTGSKERPGGAVVSQEELKAVTSNRQLIEKFLKPNPKERISSLGIIYTTPEPGEFSDVAYAAYDILSLAGIKMGGEKRTFAQRAAEAEIREGWFRYSKLVAEKDAELASRVSKSLSYRGNRDIERNFKDEIAQLKEKLPAWKTVFGDNKKSFDQNIDFIEEILNAELVDRMEGPKRQMWEQIAIWHAEYKEAKRAYDSIPTSDTREREYIRDFWGNRTSELRLENTYFADFHSRWLSGDEIIDVNELIKRELPPTQGPTTSSVPDSTIKGLFDKISSLSGG